MCGLADSIIALHKPNGIEELVDDPPLHPRRTYSGIIRDGLSRRVPTGRAEVVQDRICPDPRVNGLDKGSHVDNAGLSIAGNVGVVVGVPDLNWMTLRNLAVGGSVLGVSVGHVSLFCMEPFGSDFGE